MNAVKLSFTKIAYLIDFVKQRRGTGELVLTSEAWQSNMSRDSSSELDDTAGTGEVFSESESGRSAQVEGMPNTLGDRQWHLYFFQGCLFYATDSLHYIRRWQRSLKQYCPNFAPDISSVDKHCWYSLLEQGITQGYLSLNQAKSVIQTGTLEVFFELVSCPSAVTSHWQASKRATAPIVLLDAKQVLHNAKEIWEQWLAKDLGLISPNLAPVLKQLQQRQGQNSKNASQKLVQLLNGQNTLWDIAYQLRQPAWAITLSLLALVRQGRAQLKEVPDLPLSSKVGASSKLNLSQPLIACIDDSPVVGQVLEKILTPAGYRLLKITEPLQQMPLLVKEKPDLIFLDLLMPDVSGYSLCAFLHQTTVFQKTPIVILTSRDNIINRSKAQLTGAVDFLSKPPDAKKVLQVLQKYLPSEQTQKFDLKLATDTSG